MANQPVVGEDLGLWATEELGFIAAEEERETRTKAFEPWDQERLPPPTASLLAVASANDLLVAAGPESVIVVRASELQNQYIPKRRKKGDVDLKGRKHEEEQSKVTTVRPELQLPLARATHVAFSSDESRLVVVLDAGAGLAVYKTPDLLGNAPPNPASILQTPNSASVRHALPNPDPNSAHLIAVVLANGNLVLANLNTEQFVIGPNGGEVFHEHVSCASWSKLGKQIIAGLEDGSAAQIDQQGAVKDRIPRPPQLGELANEAYESAKPAALPLMAISWLTTHEFLLVYTPLYPPDTEMPVNDSIYLMATREKGKPFTFRKFGTDPCGAFIVRTPPHHYIQRLSHWSDTVIVASTACEDIGLLARPEGGEFNTVEVHGSRSAALPLSITEGSEGSDTSAVGVALDFTATVLYPRPIPHEMDAIANSPFPLPAMWILTTEGHLLLWWVIYNPAVRQNAPYPDMKNKAGPFETYHQRFGLNELDEDTVQALLNADDSKHAPTAEEAAAEVERLKQGTGGGKAASAGELQTPSPQDAAKPKEPEQPSSAKPTQPDAFKSAFPPAQPSTFAGFAPKPAPPAQPQQSLFNRPGSGGTAFPPPLQPQPPSFGSASSPGTSSRPTTGGASLATPGTPGFGTTSALGQKPAWGNTTTPAATFSSASKIGQGGGFSQYGGGAGGNTASPLGAQPSGMQAGFGKQPAGQPSGFAALGSSKSTGLFGGGGTHKPPVSPFHTFGQQPALKAEASMGSTATLGSTGSDWSFGPKMGMSKESSAEGDSFKAAQARQGGLFANAPTAPAKQGGLFGSAPTAMSAESFGKASAPPGGGMFGGSPGGFKLGSTFKGDGTAKDDFPKPKDPGSGMFGSGFGDALGGTQSKKPAQEAPQIKREPSSDGEGGMDDIPEAPLPPDPSTYKAHPMDDLPPSGAAVPKNGAGSDAPIAGSPPVDLGSERLSSNAGSEQGGPDEEEWDDEDEEHSYDGENESHDDESYVGEDDEEHSGDDEQEDDTPENPMRKPAFGPVQGSPHSRKPIGQSTTPSSDLKSSYTPAGLPKGGPVFPPPSARPTLIPRSPSPVRSATSPARPSHALPPQIKQTSIPPAPPVERPAAPPPQAKQPTASELEDEALARLKALLNAPIEPSRTLAGFYTHHELVNSFTHHPGPSGPIEQLRRDIECMVDTVGLNARSVASFVRGHEEIRPRTREHLDDDAGEWRLGELGALGQVEAQLENSLEANKLRDVRAKLQALHEDAEILKLKAKTVELRRVITAQTDPERLAALDAAPLAADARAQQADLRQSLTRVQKLLAQAEEGLSLLRAELVTRPSPEKPAATPSVEAVMKTISRMTAMATQRSADVDVLEARIRRLPGGLAALKLSEGYEDDLVSGLMGSRLLTGSPAATPPRRPRMADNGEALGMAGMFGSSRIGAGTPGSRGPRSGGLGKSTFGRSGGSSVLGSSFGGRESVRRRMGDVSEAEVEVFQARRRRREAVVAGLRAGVESKGVRVVRVG